MLYPSINLLRTKVDSKYTLVAMASKRARDIIDGKPVLVDDPAINKPVSTTPVMFFNLPSNVSSMLSNQASNIILPFSVITGPSFFCAKRNSTLCAPCLYISSFTKFIAFGVHSTGTGNLLPSLFTIFDSSTNI